MSPPHSDEDASSGDATAKNARSVPAATTEDDGPIHVTLETEPPQRKPGRPRLDISANFQDTGEMANHSHRLVWCIACIKSGRPMFKRDRMPARGDLMQRHLQTCKYVEESVRQRFRRPPRSGSVSSSAGESKARKARIACIISEPLPLPNSAARHQASAMASNTKGGSGYQQGQQRPGTAPVTLPSIATAVSMSPVGSGSCNLTIPPPLPLPLPLRQSPYSLGSSHSPSNPENQLPRIRSPQIRSTTSMELPSISRRPHPYMGRPELFSGGGPSDGNQHRSPGPRVLQTSPQRLGLRVSPESSSRTPSSVHTSPSLPSNMGVAAPSNLLRRKLRTGSAALGIVLQIASADSARLAARLGYDWACIDVGEEHYVRTPTGSSVMAGMVAAVSASAVCAAVVRVPYGPHWPASVWAAVEAGAHALIVPGVNDSQHLRAVVAECRRATAAQSAVDGPARDVLFIPQIDSPEDVDNVLATDGIDAAVVTAMASVSPVLVDQTLRASQYRAVPVGADCRDSGAARRMLAQGFQMVTVAVDVDLLQAAAVDQLRKTLAPL
ncbi:hypothetical protein GGI20_000589 [Coemansia sp. BCRC 34301]|nr:hypothetical protein GGI20_000589 [Coemansia sp. BCRC 34301]